MLGSLQRSLCEVVAVNNMHRPLQNHFFGTPGGSKGETQNTSLAWKHQLIKTHTQTHTQTYKHTNTHLTFFSFSHTQTHASDSGDVMYISARLSLVEQPSTFYKTGSFIIIIILFLFFFTTSE